MNTPPVTLTAMQERCLKLLGSGLDNHIVATTVGCEPSYVSNLLADENFKNQVQLLRSKQLTKATERDNAIDDLEDYVLDKLKHSLEFVMLPDKLLGAFRVINQAKRRGQAPAAGVVVNNTVVNLQLPPAILRQFTMNANQVVVEVEGRSMTTMPAKQLLENLAQRTNDGNKYQEIARRIPATYENDGR